MSNVREKTIGDNHYEVTLFVTSRAAQHLRKLIKVAGPSFAAIAEGYSNELSVMDDQGPMTKAMVLLAENIDKEDVVQLMKDLVANTHRNGSSINFDHDFMGKLNELFELLSFIIQENYGGFFALRGSDHR